MRIPLPNRQPFLSMIMLLAPGLGIAADYQSAFEANSYEQQQGYDCLIEAHAVVDVSTRETGVLENLAVSRGDIVKKGQELASLDSGTEQLAVELAQARAEMTAKMESKDAGLAYLLRQQKRIDDLFAKKATPFHEKDKADTDVMLARIELRDEQETLQLAQIEKRRAEHYLARRTIHSPVDGVVVKNLLDPGESVEDRPVMTLAQVHPLNVEVILPVKLYGQVKVGDVAEIKPMVPGGETVRATVIIVDRVVDAASNTFGIRLELPNPEYSIPSGLRCDINLQAGE